MRRVLKTNELKRKIILYKTTSNYEPENMTVEQKRKRKDVSKKFRISPIDSESLKYIKSPTVILKVFPEEQKKKIKFYRTNSLSKQSLRIKTFFKLTKRQTVFFYEYRG
ncbi:hypothetical protein CDIK_2926 [Cucumispora dikerogammari]|nr:hypothetical protein CDIK_2926 [Cucumispora dikerogammari]